MPLIPKYTNPLQDYVNIGSSAAMTVDGIVVDKIYALTGVIDTITTNNLTTYQDPVTNQVSSPGQISVYDAISTPSWTSPIQVDDVYNTGFSLAFTFNRPTFIDYVSFQILSVPCTWTLSQFDTNTGISTQLYSNTIVDTSSAWQTVNAILPGTYEFTSSVNLVLTINKTVTGTQYYVGVRDLLTKLRILNSSDLNVNNTSTTISGFIVQNNLGFIENYSLKTNNYSNMLGVRISGVDQYWKSSPQPVKDAIVYFIVDLGWQQTINKMYLDPLYSGNVLNLYYSSDCINWNPIPKDLSMKKGIYDLPLIDARYIKVEITQLTAEPYDLPFDSVAKVIEVFPDWVDSYFITLEQALLNAPSQTYFPTTSNPTPNVNYNNTPSTPTNYGIATSQLGSNTYGSSFTTSPNNLGAANLGVTNNTYTIIDPTTSYKTLEDVSNIGSIFANVDATTFINRRFYSYGPHEYKYVLVNQTWHQAYFTGIKKLSFYCFNPLVQNGREDFSDYFYPTTTDNINFTPSANTLINTISGTTATIISGGGYTGLAGTTIQTQNLNTTNQFSSFKFAASNTDWQSFLSDTETLLLGTTGVTGVTVSGVPFSNIYPAVDTSNINYGIYTISGSTGTTSLQSANGGGTNLFTTSEANFTAGGWSGGPSVTGTNTTISGLTLVQIPVLSQATWDAAYGEPPYADEAYLASPTFGQQINQYDFLVTVSGNGSVTINIIYLNSAGSIVQTYTQTNTVNGSSTQLNFSTTQPVNSSQIKVTLVSTGTLVYSKAGLFLGYTSNWVGPIITQNMRVSAVARIYLPNTNKATYTCALYTSTGILLAQKSFKNIPTQTWVDIEVPFTLPSSGTSTQFYVKLTQTFGAGEIYSVSLLGMFYNPVSYQFSTDGITYYPITIGVNNPNASINLPGLSQTLIIKGTILEDNSTISAIDIVPVYTQTPFYTSTIMNYLGDPKVNQMSNRDPVTLKPLFQLDTNLHPLKYDITQLMGIYTQYSLD